ncbi:MAG TPA: pitrilysin family protein [Steroidobacteraceae bacterium]|nr:pitrilysin family protein [Steroidobacteraceae bacterium]
MTSTRRLLAVAGLSCAVFVASVADARKIKPTRPEAVPPPAAAPAAASAPPERVTTVEGITEYRLANGLRVLLFPDQSKQTITVNMTYLVGSRMENYGETGMAHLLEHMLFKGSTNHTDVVGELSAHGARPNGTTSWDRTNYFETFAASEENLRWALSLEADRMVNSFVAKKDLDSEMTVVRNEYEGGENQPTSVLFKRALSIAYDWHNYGKEPIGARSDIEGVPIERLQAFYRTYYQPDNAVLLVAGKIDEAATLKLVQQTAGAIPRPTRVLPEQHTVEPTQDGERLVTLRREGDVQVGLVGYHIPSGTHEDAAPLQVLSQVLGDSPSGRLYKALVETGKVPVLFPAVLQLRDPGMSGFCIQMKAGQTVDAPLAAMTALVEKPAAQPVTDAEVERARTQILSQIDLSLNNSERVGLTLSDYEGMGDWRLLFLQRDRLRKVTTADVQRVWAEYFKPSNRITAIFYPTKTPDRAEIPPNPDVLALVKDYKGDAARAEGEVFDSSPANLDARTQRDKLPNGTELALLPKKTRGGTVFVGIASRWGDVKSLMNQGEVPSFTMEMLERGTSKHTRQQIQDEFDRLKARVSTSGWGSGMYTHIETTRENLPAVLALVAEILRDPVFDAKELEQLRAESIAGLEQQRKEPSAIAFTAFQKLAKPYPKGDIRYVDSVDEGLENIKAVTRDQLVKFHHDFFGAPAQIAAVGDFDAADFEAQAKQLFSDWKAPKPYTRVPEEYFPAAVKTQTFETPDKAQAFFVAGMNLNIRDDDADYPALVLGNYMLGGGFLNSRLMARIRGKDGLSYGVGSQLNAASLDKTGSFLAYAIYAPQNLAKLEQAFKEEMARALNEDFTADEIEKAKSGWLQGRSVSRSQDNEVVGTLQHYLFIGRTFAWDADFEKKVMALNAAQIRAALDKYIDPSKFVVMKAGDFAGAAKASAAPAAPAPPAGKPAEKK